MTTTWTKTHTTKTAYFEKFDLSKYRNHCRMSTYSEEMRKDALKKYSKRLWMSFYLLAVTFCSVGLIISGI